MSFSFYGPTHEPHSRPGAAPSHHPAPPPGPRHAVVGVGAAGRRNGSTGSTSPSPARPSTHRSTGATAESVHSRGSRARPGRWSPSPVRPSAVKKIKSVPGTFNSKCRRQKMAEKSPYYGKTGFGKKEISGFLVPSPIHPKQEKNAAFLTFHFFYSVRCPDWALASPQDGKGGP